MEHALRVLSDEMHWNWVYAILKKDALLRVEMWRKWTSWKNAVGVHLKVQFFLVVIRRWRNVWEQCRFWSLEQTLCIVTVQFNGFSRYASLGWNLHGVVLAGFCESSMEKVLKWEERFHEISFNSSQPKTFVWSRV